VGWFTNINEFLLTKLEIITSFLYIIAAASKYYMRVSISKVKVSAGDNGKIEESSSPIPSLRDKNSLEEDDTLVYCGHVAFIFTKG